MPGSTAVDIFAAMTLAREAVTVQVQLLDFCANKWLRGSGPSRGVTICHLEGLQGFANHLKRWRDATSK